MVVHQTLNTMPKHQLLEDSKTDFNASTFAEAVEMVADSRPDAGIVVEAQSMSDNEAAKVSRPFRIFWLSWLWESLV